MTRTILARDICLTGLMTEAGVSGKSDLDTGQAGDGRKYAPTDVAIEMAIATAVTPVTADTAGATTVERTERKDIGKRRMRSSMVWTMRHQAQELTQLHRTIGHLTNLLEAQAAREEAQWRGIMTWM